jgi:hypothetical protein
MTVVHNNPHTKYGQNGGGGGGGGSVPVDSGGHSYGDPNYNPGAGAVNVVRDSRGNVISSTPGGSVNQPSKSQTLGQAVTGEQQRLAAKYPGYVASDQQRQRENIAANLVQYGTPISPSNRVSTQPTSYPSYDGPRPGPGDPTGIGAGMAAVPGYRDRNTAGYVNYPSAWGGGQYDLKQQEAANRGYTGYTKTAFGGGMGGENIPGTDSIFQKGGEDLFDRVAAGRSLGEGGRNYNFTGAKEGFKMFGLGKIADVPEGATVGITVDDKSFTTADEANAYIREVNLGNANEYRQSQAQSWRNSGVYAAQEKPLTYNLVPKVEGFGFVGQYVGSGFDMQPAQPAQKEMRYSTMPGVFNLGSSVATDLMGDNLSPTTTPTTTAPTMSWSDRGIMWLGEQKLPLSGYLTGTGQDVTLGGASRGEIQSYGLNVGTLIGGGGEAVVGAKTVGAGLVSLGRFGASWVASFETAKVADKVIPEEGMFSLHGAAVLGVSMVAGGVTYKALGGGVPKASMKTPNANEAFTTQAREFSPYGEVNVAAGRETFELVGNRVIPKPVKVNMASDVRVIGGESFTGSTYTAGTADFPLKMGAYLKSSRDIIVNPTIESFSESSVFSGKGASGAIERNIGMSEGVPIAKVSFPSQTSTLTDTITKTYGGNLENIGVENSIAAKNTLSPGASIGRDFAPQMKPVAEFDYGRLTGARLGGKNMLNIQGAGTAFERQPTYRGTDIPGVEIGGSRTNVAQFADVTVIQPEIGGGRYTAQRTGTAQYGNLDTTLAEIKYSQGVNFYPEPSEVNSFQGGRMNGPKSSLNNIYNLGPQELDNAIKNDFPRPFSKLDEISVRGNRFTDYRSMREYSSGVGLLKNNEVTYNENLMTQLTRRSGRPSVSEMIANPGLGKGLNGGMFQSIANWQPSRGIQISSQGGISSFANSQRSNDIVRQALGVGFSQSSSQYNLAASVGQTQLSASTTRQIVDVAQIVGQTRGSMQGLNIATLSGQPSIGLQTQATMTPSIPGMRWSYPGFNFGGGWGGRSNPLAGLVSPPAGGGGGGRGFGGFRKSWWRKLNPFLSGSQALKINIGGF